MGITNRFATENYVNTAATVAVDEKLNEYVPMMTQIILPTTGWDDTTKSQTISVTGILADTTAQNIQVNPIPASMYYAIESGFYCSAQEENSLTFSCSIIPTKDITLNIVWQKVNYIS